MAICGETGFDSAVMTLICFLFSGHGIFGTQLLVNGKVSDFWVGVFEKEHELKQKLQRSQSKLAILRASSSNGLVASLGSRTQFGSSADISLLPETKPEE